MTIHNVQKSFELVKNYKESQFDKLMKKEEYINYLNKKIVEFTTLVISNELPLENNQTIGLFLKVSADLERIGDHAVNIAQRAKTLHENKSHFSEEAVDEISIMSSLCTNILNELKIENYNEFHEIVDKVDIIEESIDKTNHQFSVNQLKRLKDKKCSTENSVVFTKILTDFERIGDHGLNIAVSFSRLKKILATMKMSHV